jgi:hypothetical protein
MQDNRRHFLRGMVGITGGLASLGVARRNAGASAQPEAGDARGATVRDKLWIWGHVAGSHNEGYGIPGNSRMTPAEGAFYLGVPNLIFVAYNDPKEPCKMLPAPDRYDEYALSFSPLERVVWSIVGAGGHVDRGALESFQQLAAKFTNIVGAQMDDFFRETLDGGRVGVLTPGELAYIQDRLNVSGRKLGLWVTLYQTDLQYDLSQFLNHVDAVTYWTWRAKDLDGLEKGFAQAEKAAPRARKILGCYMWDYGAHQPMPVATMEKQCTLGLEWLRSGRIDGMIFLASCICDLGLETVEWTRNWIRQVGDARV